MAVPGERPDVNAPTPSGSGASGDDAGAAVPRYASNTEILAWLDVLLKGKPDEQAKARTEIAIILEARGFEEDAEEAYWANVQARTTDRRAYDRLIDLYQRRRDRLSETLVQRQLDDVFPTVERSSRPTAAGDPDDDSSPDTGRRGSRASSGPESADNPTFSAPNWPTLPPATGLPPDQQRAEQPAAGPASSQHATSPAAGPGTSVTQSRSAGHLPARPAGAVHRAAGPPQPGMQPVRAADVLSARSGSASAGGQAGTEQRRRRTPLLPNPEPSAARLRFTTRGLIALEPMTIGAFLLASFGAAALIAFLLLATERGRATPAPSPANGLPARCTDAAVRFPGANDPRAAVVAAYRQQGVDVENPRPGNPRLSPEQAEQVVGGWMAISLLLEHGGQTPPNLATWLDADTKQPALANVLLAGRTLGSMITPEEWAEMKAWPPNSCAGAFMQEPRNAPHVQRIERVVGR